MVLPFTYTLGTMETVKVVFHRGRSVVRTVQPRNNPPSPGDIGNHNHGALPFTPLLFVSLDDRVH